MCNVCTRYVQISTHAPYFFTEVSRRQGAPRYRTLSMLPGRELATNCFCCAA